MEKGSELCLSLEKRNFSMDKKGQFFLVAAFIIAGVIIGMGKINNYITPVSQPFVREDVNKELERESQVTVNYIINNSKDALSVMQDFTQSYVQYMRAKIPNSQYFFLYAEPNQAVLFAFGDITKVNAKMKNTFTFVNFGGDFYRAYSFRNISVDNPNPDNQVNVSFYGNEYSINMKARDFYYIVRAEDENGVFVSR